MGVLVYRQEFEPHLVGAVRAYWQRLARVVMVVGMMMMMMAGEAGVVAAPPVDDPTEVEDEAEADDDDNDPPRCLGHPLIPPNKPPLEVPGARADRLESWVKRIYNDVYV